MIRLSMLAVMLTSFALMAGSQYLQQGQQLQEQEQQDDDEIVVPADDENAAARRDFMRTKLLYTQNVFAGLTLGDFDAVDAAVKEVQAITEGGRWVAIDDDYYRKLMEEFKTSTRRLAKASKTKNVDATALRFYEMSTRCIDCHEHIRHAKYEF